MMARFESGEVLLTTRMSDVFEGLLYGVIPRDIALSEFACKGVMVERGHVCALAKTQPALGVITAGQFDLHVTLPLARSQRKGAQRGFVNFERDGHARRYQPAKGEQSLN